MATAGGGGRGHGCVAAAPEPARGGHVPDPRLEKRGARPAGTVVPWAEEKEWLPEIVGDELGRRVAWNDGTDVSRLAGRPVRLRFHLTQGDLYAFWVSPDPSGASHGFVAAGGPGFTGPRDTMGRSALNPNGELK